MKFSDFKINNKGSVPVIGALAISGVLYAFNLYSLDNSTVKYNSVEDNRISNALSADFYSSVKKIDQAVQSGDLTACDSSPPTNRFNLTSKKTGISEVVKGNSQYLKIEKCVPRKTSTAQWNNAFRNLTNPDRGECVKSTQEIKVDKIECSSLDNRYAVL